MSDNPLTDILSGVSNYLSETIDDRLDQRFATTVLAPAIREEISRIIDGRIATMVNAPDFQTRIEKAVDERALHAPQITAIVHQAVKESIHELMKGAELRVMIQEAAKAEAVARLPDSQTLKRMIAEVLEDGSFDVTFSA